MCTHLTSNVKVTRFVRRKDSEKLHQGPEKEGISVFTLVSISTHKKDLLAPTTVPSFILSGENRNSAPKHTDVPLALPFNTLNTL